MLFLCSISIEIMSKRTRVKAGRRREDSKIDEAVK